MSGSALERSLHAARKLSQQGKTAEAIAEYKQALSYAPGDVQLINTIGDLCVRAGRTAEAIKFFTAIAKKYSTDNEVPRAIAVYKKILKLDPRNTDLMLKLGDLYRQQGLVVDARHQYAAAAEAFRRTGKLPDALRVVKRIADLEPESVTARMDLAETYLRAGFSTEAHEACVQAGQEFLRESRLDDANRAFRKALDVNPDSRPALKGLAEVATRRGNPEEAVDMLRRAVSKAPDDIDLLVILGRSYTAAEMLDQAELAFVRLLELDNSRYVYLIELAQRFLERGEYDRTIAIVDRCVDLMLARRHKKRATALLKEVVARDNDNIPALKSLARIYETVGERRNLLAALNALASSASHHGDRDEAVDALRKLVELEPTKAKHREQLAQLDGSHEKGLALADDAERERRQEELDDLTSGSSEYSTELLVDMIAQHPEFRLAQIKLLEDLIAGQPAYIEGRLKLKQHYTEGGLADKALAQCEEIARLYAARGDAAQAAKYESEARALRGEAPAALAASASVLRTTSPGDSIPIALPGPSTPGVLAHPLDAVLHIPLRAYLDREWRRAARDMSTLAVLRIALDRYEELAGAVGADTVDAGLEQLASVLEHELQRPSDIVARCGSSELFVILPGTHEAGAKRIADRLRASTETVGVLIAGPSNPVTVSIALGTAVPESDTPPDRLIRAVDVALDKARAGGGNAIVTADLS